MHNREQILGVRVGAQPYSRRGAVVGMESSHGTLLSKVKRTAEGLEVQSVYGDAASTTTTSTYDTRLRLQTQRTVREKAVGWSAVPAGAGTTPRVLESLAYAYDRVGNPLSIFGYDGGGGVGRMARGSEGGRDGVWV
jgi:hypothetical protein